MHPWFQAARADPGAPSAEYFTFHHHPDEYESWLGVRSLPKLNYRSRSLREAVYEGPDSVFRRWLKKPYSIDGWRVDVANMLARHGKDQLEMEVWTGIRQAVKSENPQAYLLGENFFDSTSQLQGDRLDATMNYAGFTNPVLYWLDHFQVSQHGEPGRVEAKLPWPTQAFVHGDAARIRLAIGLLFTYVGVPCVYYGDEIGMTARDSLEARNCMIWDPNEWDQGLRSFYRRLIRLRRTSPALIDGGLQILSVEENGLTFLRDSDTEQLLVIGNRGPGDRPAKELFVRDGGIPDGMIFTEVFTGRTLTVQNGYLPLPLVPVGIQIWQSVACKAPYWV
jgi:alpha-glucosidase